MLVPAPVISLTQAQAMRITLAVIQPPPRSQKLENAIAMRHRLLREDGGDFVVKDLSAWHDRTLFCCGHARIDDFLHHDSLTLMPPVGPELVRAATPTPSTDRHVVGYYTLTQATLDLDALEGHVRKSLQPGTQDVCVMHFLGVDASNQNKGLGSMLVVDAAVACHRAGCSALVVEGVNDAPGVFFEGLGWIPLPDKSGVYFLPTSSPMDR